MLIKTFLAGLLVFLCFQSMLTAQQVPSPAAILHQPAADNDLPHRCGTPSMTPEQRRYTLDVIDRNADLRNAGMTVLPIRVHIVNMDDGSGGISLEDVNIGISYLNYLFWDAGIEYFIADVNSINSSAWFDFSDTEEAAMTAAHTVDDAANIYFVGDVTIGSDAVCGYAYYPGNSDVTINVLMDKDCTVGYANGTLVHEMGHFFNLQHTHDGTENGNSHSDAEHVPRSGANSNCTTHGDMLCDTEADPRGSNNSNCDFINNGTSTQDIHGNTYAPDLDNIMSYYSDYCGGSGFTTGQNGRITGALATRLSHTAYDLDGAGPATVTDPSGLTAALNNDYGVDLNWTDNASNETGYLIERSADGGTTWRAVAGGGVGPDATSYTDNTIQSNTTYQYRVKASNDDANDYSNTTAIAVGLTYCRPTHQSNSCDPGGSGLGVAVYNFLLEETSGTDLILNTANGCAGALSVFSPSHTANVTAGSTYDFEANFQLNTPPSGTYYSQYVTIWVDLNRDGDFEDAGEMLHQAGMYGGPTISGSITIPPTASNGLTTMRIRTGWDAGGQVSNPCSYHAFSEAEDYGLIISGGLPVELIHFSGKENNGQVELNWSTATEDNNDYFTIERSTDGVNFEWLAREEGTGTTASTQHYRMVDLTPANRINYYRLTQFDLDGTRNVYNNLVSVDIQPVVATAIKPNPLYSGSFILECEVLQAGTIQLSVFDVNGTQWLISNREPVKGRNQFEIPFEKAPVGVYLVQLDFGDRVERLRLVRAK